jgi:hypothetical protein
VGEVEEQNVTLKVPDIVLDELRLASADEEAQEEEERLLVLEPQAETVELEASERLATGLPVPEPVALKVVNNEEDME